MLRKFRDALIDNLARTGTSVAELARATKVSQEQLKKVRQREGASTNVDDAVKIAHYFGMSLDEFLNDQTVAIRKEVLGLYEQLSDAERQLLREIAEGRGAQARTEDSE